MTRYRRTAPPRHHAQSGFTLIELLVVIAIIAILASILFPVFATAREKGRQAVCQSNLKQFMLGITMYTSDNNEKMPLSISGKSQVGPGTAQANPGTAEFGVHDEIMPYIKSRGLFECPDDPGFKPGGSPTCGGKPCGGDTIAAAYGTSYKFTKENFSIFPSQRAPAVTVSGNYNCTTGGSGCASANTNPKAQIYTDNVAKTGLHDPPFPMPITFFLRPSETRVMRCFVGPWEDTVAGGGPITAGKPAVFHNDGEMMAFMDGHVKWVKSQEQEYTYCNGPTLSPARNADPTLPGDNSCGAERVG